jgi:hypothetical protein
MPPTEQVSKVPGKVVIEYILYAILAQITLAIDHKTMKTGLPVRSAVLNHCAGRLVVGWVTTSESLLLIVFVFLFF